jgi:hypothetical protein
MKNPLPLSNPENNTGKKVIDRLEGW